MMKNTMKNKRNILVIGGLGFIGWHVSQEFLERGHYVNIYDKEIMMSEERIALANNYPALTVLDNCYTQDFPSKDPAIVYHDDGMYTEHVNAILHFGEFARVEQSMFKENIQDVIDTNVAGTANVFNFLTSYENVSKAPLLFYAGSSSRFSSKHAIDESLYAFTKAQNAEFAKNLSKWFGYKTCVLYFYNVFGESRVKTLGSMQTVIDAFFDAWSRYRKIKVYGGEQSRVFTHVDDVARNVVDLVESAIDGNAIESEYHMVSKRSKSIKIKELARMFYDDDMIEYLPQRTGCRNKSVITGNTYGHYPKTVQDYVKERIIERA